MHIPFVWEFKVVFISDLLQGFHYVNTNFGTASPCACSVMSYTLLLSLIEYKTLVLREDYERAEEVLPTIPKEHLNR